MPIESRTVTVEGHRLHYLEAGDPDAPPVLLLHGWPTSARLYRHALPEIGKTRRAIALDLPGFGDSDKPDASYSFRFHDRMLTGFLDAIGVKDTGLVVHDLGGPIGLHWALHNRDRVTDLVLMNTLVFPEMSWAVVAFVAASYLPGVRRVLSSRRGITWAMRFGVNDKSRITPEVADIYTAPFPTRDARKALLKSAHGLHPKGFQTLANGIVDFADIPVSIIYGEDDRILPDVAKTMARVSKVLPHATTVSIRDCGHFLQEDRPREVTAHLARVLTPREHAP